MESSDKKNHVMTIQEHMDSFKKHLWGDEKPMDFASDVVEELLLEIQRQRTVMRAALDEIDRMWETHLKVASETGEQSQLVNLMDSLGDRRRGFYAQYLSPEEYSEFIRRSTNMDLIATLGGDEDGR